MSSGCEKEIDAVHEARRSERDRHARDRFAHLAEIYLAQAQDFLGEHLEHADLALLEQWVANEPELRAPGADRAAQARRAHAKRTFVGETIQQGVPAVIGQLTRSGATRRTRRSQKFDAPEVRVLRRSPIDGRRRLRAKTAALQAPSATRSAAPHRRLMRGATTTAASTSGRISRSVVALLHRARRRRATTPGLYDYYQRRPGRDRDRTIPTRSISEHRSRRARVRRRWPRARDGAICREAPAHRQLRDQRARRRSPRAPARDPALGAALRRAARRARPSAGCSRPPRPTRSRAARASAAFKMPSKAMMRDAGIEPTRWLAVARQWVMNAVAGLAPDLLVVDTFPGGSFGELVPVLETVPTRVLVARAVRDEIAGDDAYAALLAALPAHDHPRRARHRADPVARARGAARSRDGAPRARRRPIAALRVRHARRRRRRGRAAHAARAHRSLVARGWHVVVGAGPLYLGPERRGPHITWMDRYVPLELLGGVDAAVSAGGYNSVTELMFAGVPTVFLPQPRIADDQEGRARPPPMPVPGGSRRRSTRFRICSRRRAIRRSRARSCRTTVRARAAAADPRHGACRPAIVAIAQQPADAGAVGARAALAGSAGDAALELVTAIAGDAPSAMKERDAVLASLVDDGVVLSAPARRRSPATARVERFLARRIGECAPREPRSRSCARCAASFPPAGLDGVVDACAQLFPAFARFADWMGAVVARQRAARPARRSRSPTSPRRSRRWLATEHDLFDALRRFAHLEGNGERSLADVLRTARTTARSAEVLVNARSPRSRARRSTGPRTVHFDVTNACNAACITCWDHSPLLATPAPGRVEEDAHRSRRVRGARRRSSRRSAR